MGYRGRASVALIAVVLAGSLFTAGDALGLAEQALPPVPALRSPDSLPSTPRQPGSPPSRPETPPQAQGPQVPPAAGSQPELGGPDQGTAPASSSPSGLRSAPPSPNSLRSLPTGPVAPPGAPGPGNERPAAGSQTTSDSVAAGAYQGGEVARSLLARRHRARTGPSSRSRVAAASSDRAAAVLRGRKSSASSSQPQRSRRAASSLADDGGFARQALVAWILGSCVVLTVGAFLLQRHEGGYQGRYHRRHAWESRQLADDLWAHDSDTVSVGMPVGDPGPPRQLRDWHLDDPWPPWEHDEDAVSGAILRSSVGDRQRP